MSQATNFVDAVLFAEFDIDKGSVCRVQYPKEVGNAGLLAELMLPEGAHNHFQDWTFFMLNRPDPPPPDAAASDGSVPAKRWPVHAYRYDTEGETGWVLVDSKAGDGGGAHWVKALAVCSQLKSVHVWKPVLLLAVDRMYSLSTGLGEYSESPEEQCRCLYEAINSLSTASMPSVTPTQREVHRLMLAQGSAQKEVAHVGHVHWPPGSASHIPVRVPPLMQLQEVADASVTHLLRKFKSGLLCAFHAMLNKQRVLFLGHSQPAETVCLAVLSSPLLVCPPLSSVLERCYPYTTLNNLDFLETPGFIAGTTNPIFESHPEWWDVLCDIDTGRVLVSMNGDKGRRVASEPPRGTDLDEDVYEQLSTGLEARYSEYWLRACFQEYAQQLYCEMQRGSAALAKGFGRSGTPSAEMVMLYLEQLRSRTQMTDKEMLHIFSNILSFVSADEERLVRFLAMLPASSPLGPVSPIASALFHPSIAVREKAAAILRVLEQRPTTRPTVTGLNSFLQLGLPQGLPQSGPQGLPQGLPQQSERA